MKLYFRSFVIFLAAFSLAFLFSSCAEDDPGEVIGVVDDNGKVFSPSRIGFSASLSGNVNVKSASVIKLDYDLDAVDSMEMAVIGYLNDDATDFFTRESTFPSPYVKIVVNSVGKRDKLQMPFEFFVDITDQAISLYPRMFTDALISKRVENLVKKGESYKDAEQMAKKELEKAQGSVNWQIAWDYILCEDFVSDSAFYNNFLKLRDLLAQGDADLTDMKVHAADDLLERYDGFEWDGELPYVQWRNISLDFMAEAYGFEPCYYGVIDELDTIKFSESRFAGTVLVCDEHKSDYNNLMEHHWRKFVKEEMEKGVCTYNGRDTLELNDSIYYCEKGQWIVEKDQKIANIVKYGKILDETYGKCGDSVEFKVLRLYNDTLFMCYGTYLSGFYKNVWTCDSTEIDHYFEPSSESRKNSYDDARVALEYGNCTAERENEKVKLGNEFFTCNTWFMHNTAHWVPGWSHINEVAYYAGTCNEKNEGSFADVPTDSTTLHLVCRYKPSVDEAYNMLNGYGWVSLETEQEK